MKVLAVGPLQVSFHRMLSSSILTFGDPAATNLSLTFQRWRHVGKRHWALHVALTRCKER